MLTDNTRGNGHNIHAPRNEVCRDFIKDRCFHGDRCKYIHNSSREDSRRPFNERDKHHQDRYEEERNYRSNRNDYDDRSHGRDRNYHDGRDHFDRRSHIDRKYSDTDRYERDNKFDERDRRRDSSRDRGHNSINGALESSRSKISRY